ncbi:uncharacterized protein [Antedon mediterranea]|uniref:uncharacterized protein isoform X2 n=1 Tax=Antedon mediterranea TaxID=105859 RepID=UPI003AF8C6AB
MEKPRRKHESKAKFNEINVNEYVNDMIISEEQQQIIDGIKTSGRSRRTAYSGPATWPDGIVTWQYKPDDNTIVTNHGSRIIEAMEILSDKTCLTFEEFDSSTMADSKPRLVFATPEGGCYASLGFTDDTEDNFVFLGNSGCNTIGVVIHEIGHAIGRRHEHTRPDRDEFIDVITENIESGFQSQFDIVTTQSTLSVPYDLGSVMHYSRNTFKKNDLADTDYVIETHDAMKQLSFGQQQSLSHVDSQFINALYECNADCSESELQQNCKNGGFVGKDCACVCPDGLGGEYCQSLTAISSDVDDCGGHFTSDNGNIKTPNYPQDYPLNIDCTYLIEAPEGYTVVLYFEAFSIEEDSTCYWDQVYIRYDGLQFDTSAPLFCGTSLQHETIQSIGNTIMLEFHSDDFWTEPGFSATYTFVSNWGSWSEWGDCSATCGTATKTRSRECTTTDCIGDSTEELSCDLDGCSNEWGSWSEWSDCSATCGTATKTRSRECATTDCTGDITEETSCDLDGCPNEWGSWSEWGDCSATCGTATKTRSRECATNDCIGDTTEELSCDLDRCPNEWGSWSEWGDCSATCGTATKTRSRECATTDCIGDTTEETSCDLDDCPVPAIGGCTQDASENVYDVIQSENYPSGYPTESECRWVITVPEGKFGYLYFDRLDLEYDTAADACYDHIRIGVDDNDFQKFCGQNLPEDISFNNEAIIKFYSDDQVGWTGFKLRYVVKSTAPATWDSWSSWGDCSATCGTGYKQRTRTCSGSTCIGLNMQTISCDLSHCTDKCEPAMQHTTTDTGGIIKSPGYPFQYPRSYFINAYNFCDITVDVPSGKKITFAFEDLDLESWINSKLFLNRGTLKEKISGNDASQTFTYENVESVVVRFKTANNSNRDKYYRGFYMTYVIEDADAS